MTWKPDPRTMTWKPDPRTERRFGPYVLISERDGAQTAHLVTFPDGRKVRCLPDGQTSGQKRSRVTTDALTVLHELWQAAHFADGPDFEPASYLIGCLAVAGLTWEVVDADLTVTIEEWLTEWFSEPHPNRSLHLLGDLDDDGWQIVRKEAT